MIKKEQITNLLLICLLTSKLTNKNSKKFKNLLLLKIKISKNEKKIQQEKFKSFLKKELCELKINIAKYISKKSKKKINKYNKVHLTKI